MTSLILASAPGDCCATGFKHSGTPAGKTINVAEVETYVSEPKNARPEKKIILFFSDIYGPLFLNNQLVMNYYANQGFYALGLDYFFGDPIQNHADDANFDRPAWIAKSRKQAAEYVPKWIDAVKAQYGTINTKYFAVGYCFGASYAMDLGASDFLVATAFAHPAFLEEAKFEVVKAPILMSCAENDHLFPAESRRRAEDILTNRKQSYHMVVFQGVSHGFATRGDPEDPTVRWSKEESARGIVSWFTRYSV